MDFHTWSIEQWYLSLLIILAICMVFYLFFCDMVEGVGEGIPFLNPAVILAFLTFYTAMGWVLETFTALNSISIAIISVIAAIILDILLYYFVLIPLKSAEVSMAYTEESLGGQVGKVIVPVPVDGYGEVVIETVNGIISKRAASYDLVEIPYDAKVLVIEVKESTVFVREYSPIF
ncbi:hypothetical protein [Rummeliibacillus stabekisii]|uniref:Membrane protein NfeD2 N-terminal transmembrane domain-containing protein n=1 Tax=Rummeliibacillus stabekisii TaxID=241244 RepID=A0A143HET1_9BACL|nr:hypothetical protein [Rummeliibacillus stabekisii]AMX00234.1 hypothetical protein ATY39_12945 [Rummeliibacillus stabekisii]